MAHLPTIEPGQLQRVGDGVPSNALGRDGDLYLDRLTGRHWERAGGAWGIVFQPTLPASKLSSPVSLATQVTGSLPAGQVSGLTFYGTASVGSANTDLAWPGGSAAVSYISLTTGGGSLRSIAAPSAGNGSRIVIRNGSASVVTILNTAAGGGPQLYLKGQLGNLVLAPLDHIEFIYDGGEWFEVNRDIVTVLDQALGSSSDSSTGVTGTGTGDAFFTFNSRNMYTAIQYALEMHHYIEDNGGDALLQFYILDGPGGSQLGTWYYRTPPTNPGRPLFVRIPFTVGSNGARQIQIKWRDATGGRTYTIRGTYGGPTQARVIRSNSYE